MNGVGLDEQVAQQMLMLYDKNASPKDVEVAMDTVGVSVGVYIPGSCQETAAEWVMRAELALDAAKQVNGKNTMRVYYEDYAAKMREAGKSESEWVLPGDGFTGLPEPSAELSEFHHHHLQ